MNEKELLEIEGILNTNKFWTLQSGELLNIMDNLYDEIRRQRDILIQLAGEESLHQDGMYKTEMQKLHETNKRYKKSLKFYADENSYITYVAGMDIEATAMQDKGSWANKALEGDTND